MDFLIINSKRNQLDDLIGLLKKSGHNIEVKAGQSFFCKKKFYGKFEIVIALIFNLFLFIPISIKQKKFKAIILNGMLTTIPFLLLRKIIINQKETSKIIIIFFFLHNLGEKIFIKKILKILLNQENLTLIAQSDFEFNYYSKLTSKAKILKFPYCQGEVKLDNDCGKECVPYVFSGGYSNRDYECLIRAANKSNLKFIIISSKLNKLTITSPNVIILKEVNSKTFHGYLNNAKLIVLPLKENIGSSGQMVALAAMSLKKPIIYSDVNCLSQYFEENITGISFNLGDSEDMLSKIYMLWDNPDLSKKLGLKAYEVYNDKFHISNYYRYLEKVLINW